MLLHEFKVVFAIEKLENIYLKKRLVSYAKFTEKQS